MAKAMPGVVLEGKLDLRVQEQGSVSDAPLPRGSGYPVSGVEPMTRARRGNGAATKATKAAGTYCGLDPSDEETE